MDAKNRLLQAKAELKAQKDTKSVLTELIGEAEETSGAIDDATATIFTANPTIENTTTTMAMMNTTDSRMPVPIKYNGIAENNDYSTSTAPMTDYQYNPNQGGTGSGGDATPQQTYRVSTESFVSEPAAADDDDQALTRDSEPEEFFTTRCIPEAGGSQVTPATTRSSIIPETGFTGTTSPMPESNNEIALVSTSSSEQPTSMYANYSAAAPPPVSYPDPQKHFVSPPTPQQQQQPQAYNNIGPDQTPQHHQLSPQQHQLSPNMDRPSALASHNRQLSGFNSDFLMGGAAAIIPEQHDQQQQPQEGFSSSARSHASSGDYGYDDQAFEIVEEMKKKAKAADTGAREAEAVSRKLAAEADELRTDADKAEENSRSLKAAAEEKSKKGRFGGSKKQKKLTQSSDQATKDAMDIKKRFMTVQTQAYEAATLAATVRSEAERLRGEAESAELQMVSAASVQQQQPTQKTSVPAPPTNNDSGAHSYGVPSPKPGYGSMSIVPPNQQPIPTPYGQGMQLTMSSPNHANGVYNNYSGGPSPPGLAASNGGFSPMGDGSGTDTGGVGYNLPSPTTFRPAAGMTPASDPYANPFQ